MKKVLLFVILICAFVSFGWAAPKPVPVTVNSGIVKVNNTSDKDVKVLLERLNVIDKMDKNNLTRQQKKELRNEVKAIKSRLDGGYVYISGTAILIVILLILLL